MGDAVYLFLVKHQAGLKMLVKVPQRLRKMKNSLYVVRKETLICHQNTGEFRNLQNI